MDSSGASNNERLLSAARADNIDLLLEVFNDREDFDINCQDGLGNTPLHNAVFYGSTDVLEHILSHEECDVDPVNRIDKATPLHLAVKIPDLDLKRYIVENLLEAGADTTIKDKHGETVLDIVPADETEIYGLIRKARAQSSISKRDIASDDEAGSAGSGTDSEED